MGPRHQSKKPRFRTVEQEAFVNLQRTADALLMGVEKTLKPSGLSPTQYNVLRILRGAGPEGLACGEVASRMFTRDPDMTRLLDRLETRGLVTRAREEDDRRVVTTRITPAGLRLLKALDQPILDTHLRQLSHVGPRRLRTLVGLLERIREKTPGSRKEKVQ